MTGSLFLNGVDDRRDVKLFIACLFVGFLGIVLLKMAWNANQIVVTLFPCAVLVGYTFYVWHTKSYQLRGDRAGDSVYYLGFLYTLLSLGLSLYQFVMAGMGAREIVGNLGIALFTTIIGLAGRVVLTQLREDPVEIEESARIALAEAVSLVRSELSQMVEDVNIFRSTTMLSIVEGAEELSRETNQALTENVTAFTSSARAVIDRIEEVFADFGENAKKLNKVSAGTINSLEKLINRVEAIEAPQSLISAKFDPLAERISEVITIFNVRTEEQRLAVDRLRTLVEETAAKAEQSMDGMAMLASAVGTIVDGIERQTKTVTADSETLCTLADNIKVYLSEIPEKQGGVVSKLIETTEVALQNLTTSVNQTLEDLAESQRGAAGKLSSALEQAVYGVEEAVQVLKNTSSSLTEEARKSAEDAKKAAELALNGFTGHLDEIGKVARNNIVAQAEMINDTAKSLVAAASALTVSVDDEDGAAIPAQSSV